MSRAIAPFLAGAIGLVLVFPPQGKSQPARGGSGNSVDDPRAEAVHDEAMIKAMLTRAEDYERATREWRDSNHLRAAFGVWGIPIVSAVATVLAGCKALFEVFPNAGPKPQAEQLAGTKALPAAPGAAPPTAPPPEAPAKKSVSGITISLIAVNALLTLITTLNSNLKPGEHAVRAAAFNNRFYSFRVNFVGEERRFIEANKGKPGYRADLTDWYLKKSEQLNELTTAWDSDQPPPPALHI